MAFKPSLHGWGFEDAFEMEGPALGLGAAPAALGLGGGMCWAALDRYLDGRTIPEDGSAPAPGSPLHAELRQRQVAALAGLWPRLRQWQGLPDGSWRDRVRLPLTPGRGDVASLTRREWPVIRRTLKSRRPILLTLVEPEDGYVRTAAVRQVLAYGWEREGRHVTLAVYDPARPGDDEVQLGFSLSGPLDARLTGGHRVRGFFAVPYDREPAATLRAESFGDRSVLGLNRKVHGRPGAAGERKVLHVVARDTDGALLHFYRKQGRHWEGANVTEREELEGAELHSDPVPLPGFAGLGLHAFGRSYIGDLFHFRGFRKWRVSNRTETRRAGPRFRLEGAPVPAALPWGGVCVVGRGKDGTLVSYAYQPFRGWRADEVPAAAGGTISGDPAVACVGPDVHVVARGRNGHVLHFERIKGGWSSGDLTTQCAGTEPMLGGPVLTYHEDRLHILARTEGGRLLHMERGDEGQWEAAVVASGIAGDPAAVSGPGGLHAFAAGADGGLIHAWSSGAGWRVEDLVATRAALGEGPSPRAPLLAWGAPEELRLFGRRGEAFVQWVWRADTDWVAGPVSERAGVARRHQPGDPPQLVVDPAGAFHLFATDGTGTVVHFEPGDWQPPEGSGAAAESGSGARPAPRAKAGNATARESAAAANGTAAAAEAAPGAQGEEAASGASASTAPARNGKAAAKDGRAAKPAKAGKAAATNRISTPSSGLPLLDDVEEGDEEGEAMDLPLLEPDAGSEEPEDSGFEWDPTRDIEDESSENDPGGGLEPLDLETLENWPPTVDQEPPKKRPAPSPKREPPPPWPEEG